MQSEIIDEVLSVEEEAQRIIDEGAAQAQNAIVDAQAEATELLRNALREEREKNRKALQKAEDDAAEELETYTASLDVSTRFDDPDMDALAESIADVVCKTNLLDAMDGRDA